MTPTPDVAIVMGTVNRLALLKQCVESIRRAAGSLTYICLVADGNSDDGSREWLVAQPDCELLEGGRNGAVIAFNTAFARAIELQCPWVVQFNDDLTFVDGLELERAVAILKADESIGAVAFASDRYSPGVYGFHNMRFQARCYANQGLFRREAGMAAARAMGDPTGKTWWDPQYHTYASDTVLGCWLWRLGWTVYEAADIRVHDDFTATGAEDPLRAHNMEMYEDSGYIFNEQWPDEESIEYHPEDAFKFGGRTLPYWLGAKLHLGCGGRHLDGWINVDVNKVDGVDLALDVRSDLGSIPNDTLTWVYCSHLIEHIAPDLLPGVLEHLYRALAPGGKLTLATISLEGIFRNAYEQDYPPEAWNAYLYGDTRSTDSLFMAHRQCFTEESLTDLLYDAGFVGVDPWDIGQYPEIASLNDCARSSAHITLYLEAVK